MIYWNIKGRLATAFYLLFYITYYMPYGAGCVTVLAIIVTSDCANAVPLTTTPKFITSALMKNYFCASLKGKTKMGSLIHQLASPHFPQGERARLSPSEFCATKTIFEI
jgi:hypothetical protein